MIYIKKYQNNNRENTKCYGKWYGRVVHVETVDLDGLSEHIQSHGSIFTADVVQGTVKKFVQCIIELLLEGKKVRLNGLGTFYLSIDSSGAESMEEYSAQTHVKKVRVRFRADQSDNSSYATSQLTRRAKVTTNLPGSPSADDSGNGGESGGGNGGQQGGGTSGSVEEQP
jgi:predicted histone-like DNA-binding protein